VGDLRTGAAGAWRFHLAAAQTRSRIWLRPQLSRVILRDVQDHHSLEPAASRQDVEELRVLVQEFVRTFGLLVTRQTPCGFAVSPSYAHALMLLLRRAGDGLSTLQSDLAGELGIDKSNVARLCERMVKAGHAVQSVPPADGRSRIVTLTAKGTRVAQRIEQGSRDRFASVADAIPVRKRRAVMAALADLNAAVASTATGAES
jgi:DNA-binding MarR family transcriptional regulator